MKQGGEAGGTKRRHGRLKVTATKNNELKVKKRRHKASAF